MKRIRSTTIRDEVRLDPYELKEALGLSPDYDIDIYIGEGWNKHRHVLPDRISMIVFKRARTVEEEAPDESGNERPDSQEAARD